MIDEVATLFRPSFNRSLDEALDRMDAGDDATHALGVNWSMAGLPPLLETAAVLHEIPKGVADSDTRIRVRNRFMAEAAGKRVAWVHRHTTAVAKPRKRPRARGSSIGGVATILILAVIALVAGTLAAFAAGFSEPDSPLYPLKEMGEGALSALTTDPVSNADLKVTFAGQRLREAEAMAARKNPNLAVDSIRARYQDLREAAQQLEAVDNKDARWTRVRDRFISEESNTVAPVVQALNNEGETDAAQQIQALASSYDAERKVLDKQLVSPIAKPKSPPTPTPHR